jgi:hypothetical protein
MYSLFVGKSTPDEFATLASQLKPVTGDVSLWTEEQDLWSLVGLCSGTLGDVSLRKLKEWLERSLCTSATYTSIPKVHNICSIDFLDLEVLYEAMFWLLVQGRMKEALELCCNSGNYWLAVVLDGNLGVSLSHLATASNEGGIGVSGKWERVFFAALIGEKRQELMQVCNNWKVELWVLIQNALRQDLDEKKEGSFTPWQLIEGILQHEKSPLFEVTARLLFDEFSKDSDLSFLIPIPENCSCCSCSCSFKECQKIRFFAFLAAFFVKEKGMCFDLFFEHLSREFLQAEEDLFVALFFVSKMHNPESVLPLLLDVQCKATLEKRKVWELLETFSPLDCKFIECLLQKMLAQKNLHLFEWAIICQPDNLTAYYEDLVNSCFQNGEQDFDRFFRVNQLFPQGKYNFLSQILSQRKVESMEQALKAVECCCCCTAGGDWSSGVVCGHLLPLIGEFLVQKNEGQVNSRSSEEICLLLTSLKAYRGRVSSFLTSLAVPLIKASERLRKRK